MQFATCGCSIDFMCYVYVMDPLDFMYYVYVMDPLNLMVLLKVLHPLFPRVLSTWRSLGT